MKDVKKNIVYTAKDIEAYFAGTLPAPEMHAMEKAALDDPFLAEAMEGYEGVKEIQWSKQLAALHQRFAEMGLPAKVIPMNRSTGRWWKAAAAILLIGCGAALTWWLTNEKDTKVPHDQLAQTPTTQKDPGTATTTAIQPVETTVQAPVLLNPDSRSTASENKPAYNGLLSQVTTVTKPDSKTTDQDRTFKSSNPQQLNDLAKTEGNISTEEKDKNKTYYATTTSPAVPATTNNSAANNANNTNGGILGRETNSAKNTDVTNNAVADNFFEQKKKETQSPQVVSGKSSQLSRNFIAQVVGPDNSPLPFANINIKSENFGTNADVNGNFRLVSTDTLINVEVRSVGYLPKTYTLHSNRAQNKIVLTEDENTAKEKTAIVSRKSLRTAIFLKDSTRLNVEPVDGWDNYNTYIANSLDIPDDILKSYRHGEVEMSFKVHPNGAVTDIKIYQSGCGIDCAELARRLIEQGPQWVAKKGKRATARIKVQF